MKQPDKKSRWPLHGTIGILLVIVFWILNWSLEGLRTHWGFSPLWLGYSLTVDALVFYRRGTSLLTRSLPRYVGLFLVSAPAWWLFELINTVTQNWIYSARDQFTDLEYVLLASLSFSTVLPAVFGTAELVSTFRWIKNIKNRFALSPTPLTLMIFLTIGLLMLFKLLVWPHLFFPLVWISVYLILEPLNVLLNNRSLLQFTRTGNWQPVISLAVGALICGFFWEMWNINSWPKWTYYLPIANFGHVFEMPVLGYSGYIPFSWELFAIYHLVMGFLGKKQSDDYIQLGS